MTAINVDVRIGGGQPPSTGGRGKSYVLYAPRTVVNTSAGKTIVPVPDRVELDSNGTATVTLDALPAETPYVFQFEVDNGYWKSSQILAIVPASGTHKLADLVVLGDDFTPPAWFSKVLDAQEVVEEAAAQVPVMVEEAVDAEIAGRPVLEGSRIAEDDLSFAVVDKKRRRTWIEATQAGRPTSRSAALITDAVADGVGARVGTAPQTDSASDLSFAVVDKYRRRTWIEADRAGRPTARSAALIAAALPGGIGGQLTTPLDPGPNLLLIGHSMLAGASGAISSAVSDIGKQATSIAVGGESMQTISGRLGSHPTLLTVSGNEVPTSGPVGVTVNSDAYLPFGQGPSSYAGYLVLADGTKVPGTLAGPSSSITFTRTTAGAVIAATRPVMFIYDISETHRSNIFVFWAARNGSWTNANAVRERLDRMEGMIRHQKSLNRRFLVLSEHIASATASSPTSDAADVVTAITDYNRQALLRWGGNFIDTQSYMIAFGLADRGITPTADDSSDIAAGRVPRSLRGDNLHLNTEGNAVIASLVKRRLLEKGW